MQKILSILIAVVITSKWSTDKALFLIPTWIPPIELNWLTCIFGVNPCFIPAGIKQGLTPKIHVNQFNSIGGIQVGIKNNALSVDHLEVMTTAIKIDKIFCMDRVFSNYRS